MEGKVFNEEIEKYETSTKGHADEFNKRQDKLLENDKYLKISLEDKVDKERGKALSTNDFNNTYKNKLDGIDVGANKYTHPSTHSASIITEDTTHRFVTDDEKKKWDDKADKNHTHNGYEPTLSNDRKRKITFGTGSPSGGSDGDIYFQYE